MDEGRPLGIGFQDLVPNHGQRRGREACRERAWKRADLIRSGIASRKIWVITNGIDITEGNQGPASRFRRELGIEETDPLVVFVGRLSKEKGLYVLIEATKRVRQAVR